MYTDNGSFSVPKEHAFSKLYRRIEEKEKKLTPDHKHIQNIDNTRMFKRLEDLDFTQSSHRHALLLIVHQNPLERYNPSSRFLNSFMNLTIIREEGKSAPTLN